MILGLVAQVGSYFALVWLATQLPWQFSLRALFIAVTLVAVVLGLIVWVLK